jgi:hypothetical protein
MDFQASSSRLAVHFQRCQVRIIRTIRQPRVVLELAEDALRDGVLEVVGPAACDLVDPDQQSPEVVL